MDADRARWDTRYADADAADPRPPDALAAAGLIDLVPTSGRLLDVACGLGPVSRWAADRGLDVTAIDVSPVAIDALAAAPGAGRIDARVVDLDDGLPADLARADVVVCQRFRDPDVMRALPDLVEPGGLLVVTVLSAVGANDPGPFHAPPGELGELLPGAGTDWEWVFDVEADGEASAVLRRHGGVER